MSQGIKTLATRLWWLGPFGLLGSSQPALAEGALTVKLACPQLTREQAAEVETRARASLFTASVPVSRVVVSCSAEQAVASVEAGDAEASASAPLAPGDAREGTLEAIERALRDLSQRAQTVAQAPLAEPEPETAPAPSAAPAPPPPPPSAPGTASPVVAAAPRVEVQAAARHAAAPPLAAQLSLGMAVEGWRGGAALGGTLGAGYGSRTLAVVARAARLATLSDNDAFSASELSAAVGVEWRPVWSMGLQAQIALGGSLLVVAPRSQYAPRGATSVAAGFGELQLARPFESGRWALIPAAGVRLFLAQRRVNLDDAPELLLGNVAVRADLGLRYRFE